MKDVFLEKLRCKALIDYLGGENSSGIACPMLSPAIGLDALGHKWTDVSNWVCESR